MQQIQCPNCGGYDVKVDSTASQLELGCMGLGYFLLLIPGMMIAERLNARDEKEFMEGKNTATCQLCKFRFRLYQVPATPIRPNQQLIEAGRKRLREEEERRRRYYYDD